MPCIPPDGRYSQTMDTEATPTPAPGMPALYCIGSDSYAGRIVEVTRNGRTIVWLGERDEDTPENRKERAHKFNLCKDGAFRGKGRCGRLYVGDDSATDLDPSF